MIRCDGGTVGQGRAMPAPMPAAMIGRRLLLAGAAAGAAVAAMATSLSGRALAATLPPGMVLPFDVARGGSSIGEHRLRFSRDGNRLTVDIAIDLEVKVAFVPVYTYTHRNTEVWEDDKLVSMNSRTNDNGQDLRVSVQRTAEGLQVDGVEGRITAPADILTTSYWRYDTVNQTRLLDTQRGIIREVACEPVGQETVTAAGVSVPARHYRMTGDLKADLWYSQANQWVKLAFEVRGSEIRYTLSPGSQGRETLALTAD